MIGIANSVYEYIKEKILSVYEYLYILRKQSEVF